MNDIIKHIKSSGLSQVFAISLVFTLVACSGPGVRNPRGTGVTTYDTSETGFVETTGIESQDVDTVVDKMARSLMNDETIISEGKRPVVLIKIENESRFRMNNEIFTSGIITKLLKATNRKFTFIDRNFIDEDEKERNLKREGLVTSSSDPNVQEFKGADFRLQGVIRDLNQKTRAGISDTVIYSFRLVNMRTNEILWAEEHKVKKQALTDLSY